jgi:hypothetical protein
MIIQSSILYIRGLAGKQIVSFPAFLFDIIIFVLFFSEITLATGSIEDALNCRTW